MKKFGLTLLVAALGGVIAVGGYKLFENKQLQKMSFEERQELYFANSPVSEIMSSTGNPDFTQAAAVVAPAVVHIQTTYPARQARRGSGGTPFDMFEEFFGMPRQQSPRQVQPQQASGSGVIISQDGYIVTNNHVVEGADKIEVKLTDRRVLEAKIIGRDPDTDLALIKINEDGLPFARLGNSDDVRIGEWVLAVGYPLGLESTVTAGIVSATGRSTGIIQREQFEREMQQRGYRQPQTPEEQFISTAVESFIQTDAVINRGNSGGALVNARGELIGINSNIASPTGYYAGYGFAVPVNIVKKISDDFVKFGAVKRGLIGITFRELSPTVAKELNIKETTGLLINSVAPNGGAEEAGLKEGDVITEMDGVTIISSTQLQERVYLLRPGDKVKLTYKRDGREREATVTLKEETRSSASTDAEETKRSASEIYNKLGAGFVPASDERKKELGVSSGVVVTQVHRGGWFDYHGIQRGTVVTHINDMPVNNIDDIEAALGNSTRNSIKVTSAPQRGSVREQSGPIDF